MDEAQIVQERSGLRLGRAGAAPGSTTTTCWRRGCESGGRLIPFCTIERRGQRRLPRYMERCARAARGPGCLRPTARAIAGRGRRRRGAGRGCHPARPRVRSSARQRAARAPRTRARVALRSLLLLIASSPDHVLLPGDRVPLAAASPSLRPHAQVRRALDRCRTSTSAATPCYGPAVHPSGRPGGRRTHPLRERLPANRTRPPASGKSRRPSRQTIVPARSISARMRASVEVQAMIDKSERVQLVRLLWPASCRWR